MTRQRLNNRRQFLKTSLAGLAASQFPSIFCQKKPNKPNILLIMADDMGYSDLGCYGSEISTPSLDKLAQNGIRFTHFYNAARCCPTRASLMTGLYPHQAGMGGMVCHEGDHRPEGPYQGYLNDSCVTIAEVLKDAGYNTYMSGKWHVGEEKPHWPTDRGFDRYWGLISGAANYFDVSRTKQPGITRRMALDGKPLPLPKDNFYMTDATTDYAVDFLNEATDKPNPFFLYVAYTAPHWPLHALPEDIDKYRGKYMDGWEVLRQNRFKKMKELGILKAEAELSAPDPEAMPWEKVPDKELMDLKMAVYAAQIDRMDQGIGRLIKKLEASGKLQNTLILFLSDNGACSETGPLGHDFWKNGALPGDVNSYQSYGRSWSNASNTPFRLHKFYTHEGGITTPLIAHWPDAIKETGIINRDVGHIVDIMATCIDVAGAHYPKQHKGTSILPQEGKSLTPLFKNRKRKPHNFLCWEHFKNRAIRSGKWKLVEVHPRGWELYDIEHDRAETYNLAEKHPDIVEQLIQHYTRWAEKTGVNHRQR